MADATLRLRYPTGATLYTQVEGGAGAWNGTGFVSFNLEDWATYATATPETPSGSGRYLCAFPPTAPAGFYSWATYLQLSEPPAPGDPVVGTGEGYWDGTTFGGTSSVTGDVEGSVNAVNAAITLPSVPPTGYGSTVLHQGTAQAGSTNTVTLDAGAGATDDQYLFCTIALISGTGEGQAGVINGYNGATKVATVTNAWATPPDATTEFQVLPQGAVIVGQIAGGPRTVTQDWQGTDSLKVISAITGQPIQGASVIAYLATAYATSGPAAPIIAQTTTDSNGHWSLSLNPANYSLVFGHGTESATAIITVN